MIRSQNKFITGKHTLEIVEDDGKPHRELTIRSESVTVGAYPIFRGSIDELAELTGWALRLRDALARDPLSSLSGALPKAANPQPAAKRPKDPLEQEAG